MIYVKSYFWTNFQNLNSNHREWRSLGFLITYMKRPETSFDKLYYSCILFISSFFISFVNAFWSHVYTTITFARNSILAFLIYEMLNAVFSIVDLLVIYAFQYVLSWCNITSVITPFISKFIESPDKRLVWHFILICYNLCYLSIQSKVSSFIEYGEKICGLHVLMRGYFCSKIWKFADNNLIFLWNSVFLLNICWAYMQHF